MNKKKLSILIYSLDKGGAERVTSIIINELIFNYDITLILMNQTINYPIPKNLHIKYIERSNPPESGIIKLLKLPLLGYKYKKVCEENNIDVSLSFTNRPNYINIFAKLFGNKVRTIINERAMPSLQHKYGFKGFINRFLIKALYPKADAIIGNSKGNSFDLRKKFMIDKVETIYNPVNVMKNVKKKKDSTFTFITVGRLDKGKNHSLLISAMQYINAQLLIIGDGILKVNLEEQINKLNLNDKVFLLGLQNDPFKYFETADAFIFTSNHEGFPNALLEALAYGLPIISTDCKSGPREILAPNTDFRIVLKNDIEVAKYGILIPINNKTNLIKAMKIMMTNRGLYNKYKENSLTRSHDFDKDVIMKKYIKVIEN